MFFDLVRNLKDNFDYIYIHKYFCQARNLVNKKYHSRIHKFWGSEKILVGMTFHISINIFLDPTWSPEDIFFDIRSYIHIS